MTLVLYGAARSRASIPRWYLEEKGIAYGWVLLDLAAGEQRQEPFLTVNPFAKVPALVDDTLSGPDGQPLKLFESGAIVLHLAAQHGQEFDGEPGPAAARRSLAAQWILFANATLGPALVNPASREKELPRLLDTLDVLLTGGRSLLAGAWGDHPWGAADCVVQAYLAYIPLFLPDFDLTRWQNVRAVIEAARQRPAYQRAMDGR